ncbi:MAG: class I SAM-dependent methyltransferase [Pseudomonadota bacterium]
MSNNKKANEHFLANLGSFFSPASLLLRLQRLVGVNPLKLKTITCTSLAELASHYEKTGANIKAQEQYQLKLITGKDTFTAPGYCFSCSRQVDFMIDYNYSDGETVNGLRIPNWRERVTCPFCGLNNRIRASLQFLEETLGCQPTSAIYISEQTTPLYDHMQKKYAGLIGSEYLADRVSFGSVDPVSGLRNESITKLSFADASFDFVLSFDVFEHIPEYHKALQECFRVLKPGGRLLFTVPFRLDNQTNLVRATVDAEGNVQHLMEPEYHGDPISNAGCLCFYHFGWQLLDELKDCGFKTAAAHIYWSDKLGYLGQHQALFCAVKGD